MLLAALSPQQLRDVLAQPSRSGITPRWQPDADELESVLREVRARGWAVADEELAGGIRSVAVPVRDGHGQVIAAMNVTVNAAETTLETLIEKHLPRLLQAASAISADWAAWQSLPVTTAGGPSTDQGLPGPE
ncbi:IclR family transcriptional regulator C-terminal domain-containing protein [Streptomyces sp. NPDC127097]|uniref:IclR family transcriptional regulator domain-containing protein n=1 Tax=Streptomyces sp. NPDC127097 TaxID=3347136 RepID=UPI00364C2911